MHWLLLLCYFVIAGAQYEVPEATVEALYPKGFRISIPDEEGIKLFAFHGKLNEELEGREGGTFSRDITKAKNGRWTFVDKTTKLKKGDVLYYWTYVDYFDGKNKLGYVNDDQTFVVDELLTESGTPSIDIRSSMCRKSVTVSNVKNICKEQVIFEDNFKSGHLSNEIWSVEQRFADAPDYEFVMYVNRSETLHVNKDILEIQPVLSESLFGDGFVTSRNGYDFKNECTGDSGSPTCSRRYEGGFYQPPIASSQITTKNKFSFKYGTIEISAKLPVGEWVYPELYLSPVNEGYGNNYESGLIRIAFTEGNDRTKHILHGGVILGRTPAARKYADKTIEDRAGWSMGFHKFTVNWMPGSITVAVDGKEYGTIYPPENGFASLGPYLDLPHTERWKSGTHFAPFDQEMFITIGVGVGGYSFEERDDGSKPWRNGERLSVKKFFEARGKWEHTLNGNSSLKVDYVKVLAL